MSVFTTLTQQEIQTFLHAYACGELVSYEGIVAGTHNTNYKLTTTHGHYALTLFEDFKASELMPVIDFINYLAQAQLPFAAVMFNQSQHTLQFIHDKPVVLAQWLEGAHPTLLNELQCIALGTALGKMHALSQHYSLSRPNFRGAAWRLAIAKKVAPKLINEELALLSSEVAWQKQLDISHLPSGIIHADIFRDNILFMGNYLTGIIDIYNACTDSLLLDVAIAVNDCCLDKTGQVNAELIQAFLVAYENFRSLTSEEKAIWPAMLRIAALTFWLLRLHAQYFPPPGKIVFQKPAAEYRNILQQHRSA